MAVFNWLLVAVLFGVAEAMTTAMVSIWFAIGAVLAAIVSIFTDSVFVQLLVFVVSSLLLLLMFIGKARECTKVKKHTPTNADRIVGEKAQVLEEVNPIASTGQIKVLGQIWSCKSETGEVIAKDIMVEVVRIEGSKAIVKTTK